MGFFQGWILAEVDEVATVRYVNRADTAFWNKHRDENELRLLTGWMWEAKDKSGYKQGFKTQSVAYRDAYYALVRHEQAPGITRRRRLRLVRKAA